MKKEWQAYYGIGEMLRLEKFDFKFRKDQDNEICDERVRETKNLSKFRKFMKISNIFNIFGKL